MPGLSKLNNKIADKLFIVTHIPSFIIIFVFLTHLDIAINEKFKFYIDLLLVGHIGKHIILRSHEKNNFNNYLSKRIVASASFLH